MEGLVKINNIKNIKKAKIITTSVKIAEYFNRRHDNILRAIEKLDCSESFKLLNYEVTYFNDKSNRMTKLYNITKDGFLFLVMGFRGEKAAEIKEAFINEFNEKSKFIENMIINYNSEEWKQTRNENKKIRLKETDEIKKMIEYARENGSENADNYYTHFSNLIWKKLFTIEPGYENIDRNFLTTEQLIIVSNAENIIRKSIKKGLDNKSEYHDIYKNTKKDIEIFASLIDITKIPYYTQLSLI